MPSQYLLANTLSQKTKQSENIQMGKISYLEELVSDFTILH